MPTLHMIRAKRLGVLVIGLALLTALLIQAVPSTLADNLSGRFVRLSTSRASAQATYLFGLTPVNTTDNLGSIEFEVCSNDPFPGTPCTQPSGLNASAAVLANQTGETGFTLSATQNRIVLSRTASTASGVPATYQVTNIVNPDSAGSYYVRIRTFTTEEATGPELDSGGAVFAINSPLSINAEVPPFLRFCAGVTINGYDCASATSFLLNLGVLRNDQPASASSQMVVATNAGYGYSITVSGTTLTSGNNTIPALNSQAASQPGISQFGMNLRANTAPVVGANPAGPGTGTVRAQYNTPNFFKFTSGDVIVSSAQTSNNHKFSASYIANVNANQPAGVYATTISYICLANF